MFRVIHGLGLIVFFAAGNLIFWQIVFQNFLIEKAVVNNIILIFFNVLQPLCNVIDVANTNIFFSSFATATPSQSGCKYSDMGFRNSKMPSQGHKYDLQAETSVAVVNDVFLLVLCFEQNQNLNVFIRYNWSKYND